MEMDQRVEVEQEQQTDQMEKQEQQPKPLEQQPLEQQDDEVIGYNPFRMPSPLMESQHSPSPSDTTPSEKIEETSTVPISPEEKKRLKALKKKMKEEKKALKAEKKQQLLRGSSSASS